MRLPLDQPFQPAASATPFTSLRGWPRGGLSRLELAAFLLCGVLAALLGMRNADALNHDAISYVTLAQHYLDGRFDLVVVGTWSPLFIWMLVPLIALTGEHALSLHILSGLSALVFLAGGLSVLRAFAPRSCVLPGAFILATYAAVRSATLVTPDLLSAGLFGLASARLVMLAQEPSPPLRPWGMAGALIGLGYLAKAAVLPIGMFCLVAVLGLRVLLHGARLGLAARAFTAALAGVLLVGGPWMIALSLKYGTPTFSTAGKAAFAFVGPTDVDREQPTNRLFVIPEPGRQSQFEDESILPQASWSPLERPQYAVHFARLVFWNVGTISARLGEADLLHIGLPAVLAGLALLLGRRGSPPRPWHWCGVFVLCACSLYLPTFADQVRYYYLVYPHLLAASFGLALLVADTAGLRERQGWAAALVALSFLYGSAVSLREEAVRTREYEALRFSRSLAERIRAAGVVGPVATVGRQDKHPAIYTSYLLGVPYHGTEDARTVERLHASGARLLIVRRGSEQERFLLAIPEQAGDLDPLLFGGHPATSDMPFRVFLNRHCTGPLREDGNC